MSAEESGAGGTSASATGGESHCIDNSFLPAPPAGLLAGGPPLLPAIGANTVAVPNGGTAAIPAQLTSATLHPNVVGPTLPSAFGTLVESGTPSAYTRTNSDEPPGAPPGCVVAVVQGGGSTPSSALPQALPAGSSSSPLLATASVAVAAPSKGISPLGAVAVLSAASTPILPVGGEGGLPLDLPAPISPSKKGTTAIPLPPQTTAVPKNPSIPDAHQCPLNVAETTASAASEEATKEGNAMPNDAAVGQEDEDPDCFVHPLAKYPFFPPQPPPEFCPYPTDIGVDAYADGDEGATTTTPQSHSQSPSASASQPPPPQAHQQQQRSSGAAPPPPPPPRKVVHLFEVISHRALSQFLVHHRLVFMSAMLSTGGSNRLETCFGSDAPNFAFLRCAYDSLFFVQVLYTLISEEYGGWSVDSFENFLYEAFGHDRPEVSRHTVRIFRALNRSRSGTISFEELCAWAAKKLSSRTTLHPDQHLIATLMSLRLPLALFLDRKELWKEYVYVLRSISDDEAHV